MSDSLQFLVLLVIHVLTAGIAGWTAWALSRYPVIGVLGSALYTLAPYRFYSLHISRDYPEAIAWAILPFLGYFGCRIFERTKHVWQRIILCLCCFGAGIGLLNGAWWIENIKCLLEGGLGFDDSFSMQSHGVYLVHYILTFFTMGSSTDFNENGMMDSAPMGMGFVITIGVFLYIWLLITGRMRGRSGMYSYLLLMGCGAAYLSSNSCPWDDLRFSIKCYTAARILIGTPARLMGIANLFFWTVGCRAFASLYEMLKKEYKE